MRAGPMGSLTYGQLEELWVQAGGPRPLAPLMAAIALAESAGNPQALNPSDNNGTQTSWGLWQISDGTHNKPSPDILTPLGNARAAVAKYHDQGLSAWGTYDSGAYKRYYRGGVPPSQLPAGGGGGGGGGGQTALLTGWNPGDLGWLEGPLGIIQYLGTLAGQQISGNVSGIDGLAKAFTGFAQSVAGLLKVFEWFYQPSHWVRVAAGAFGVLFLIPGLYALMRSAQGGTGDISLALGILFVTLAGMLLFVAFHNLPDDVRNLQELIAWITASIRQGRPAASPAQQTA